MTTRDMTNIEARTPKVIIVALILISTNSCSWSYRYAKSQEKRYSVRQRMTKKVDSLYKQQFHEKMKWKYNFIDYEFIKDDTVMVWTRLSNRNTGIVIWIDSSCNILEYMTCIGGFDQLKH